MKDKKMKNIFFIILLALFANCTTLFPQNIDEHKYRNEQNIQRYNQTLMPPGTRRPSNGVWTELNPKIPRVDYFDVFFYNSDTGWAVGNYGSIVKTCNGGNNWEKKLSKTGRLLTSIHTKNCSILIATGKNGTILRSSDGGNNWQLTNIDTITNLWRIVFSDDSTCWICGDNKT
jgi:hypothetical protein